MVALHSSFVLVPFHLVHHNLVVVAYCKQAAWQKVEPYQGHYTAPVVQEEHSFQAA